MQLLAGGSKAHHDVNGIAHTVSGKGRITRKEAMKKIRVKKRDLRKD